MSAAKKGDYAPLQTGDNDDADAEPAETGGLLAEDEDVTEEEKLARNAGPPPTRCEAVTGIYKLAYPMTISSVLDNVTRQITVMMVGHLGPTYLGAATLGTMTCNVTGYSLCFGGMSALDTLASQAFGAQNYRLVGVWAQRGALMLALMGIPISLLWWTATDDVLHLLGVGDDETISLAVQFTRWQILGFWPTLASRVLQGFLRAQRVVKPVMYCSSIGGLLTASVSWIWVQQFGFIGAPLAQAFGAWLNLGLLWGFCVWRGVHKKCWGGWTTEALRGWGHMAKLGMAGMASTMGAPCGAHSLARVDCLLCLY
jgi:MATE family multidrug resistance protein